MVVEDARHVDLESDIVDRGVNGPADFVVPGRGSLMVVGLACGAHMGSSRARPRSPLYALSTDVDGTIGSTASFGSAHPHAALWYQHDAARWHDARNSDACVSIVGPSALCGVRDLS
jgi:hypothetical protein